MCTGLLLHTKRILLLPCHLIPCLGLGEDQILCSSLLVIRLLEHDSYILERLICAAILPELNMCSCKSSIICTVGQMHRMRARAALDRPAMKRVSASFCPAATSSATLASRSEPPFCCCYLTCQNWNEPTQIRCHNVYGKQPIPLQEYNMSKSVEVSLSQQWVSRHPGIL